MSHLHLLDLPFHLGNWHHRAPMDAQQRSPTSSSDVELALGERHRNTLLERPPWLTSPSIPHPLPPLEELGVLVATGPEPLVELARPTDVEGRPQVVSGEVAEELTARGTAIGTSSAKKNPA
jgi:hypothetical protein